MPIKRGTDTKGSFYKYGDSGKKYYYESGNKQSRDLAHKKASKQGVAIEISRHS